MTRWHAIHVYHYDEDKTDLLLDGVSMLSSARDSSNAHAISASHALVGDDAIDHPDTSCVAGNASVDHVDFAHASAQGVERALGFRDHAAGDDTFRLELRDGRFIERGNNHRNRHAAFL